MTVYVRRSIDGAVNLVTSSYYEDEHGSTSEELPDDHHDVVAFLNPPATTPPLTARQLRLGLVLNEISLERVEAAINAIDGEQARAVAKVEWEWASSFDRDHSLLRHVGSALGLTQAQIDAMWKDALTL